MQKVYGTYRPKRITSPFDLGNNISLNGTYTPGFFISNQFKDYEDAGLTKILDSEIPEANYTGEIVPGVKKLTRFIIGEYNETYINGIDFANNVAKVGAEFNIEIFSTPADAITWIKANTNLVEETPGNFLVSPEITGMMGEIIPAKYLNIV